MSSFVKIAFLLLLIFVLTACIRQSGAIPLTIVSASPTPITGPTLTPTISPSSAPQSLEPKHLFSLGRGEMPIEIKYSPDGKFIFTTYGDTDQNFKVYWLDAQTKKELMSFKNNAIWSNGVLAYSHDNTLVAINASIRQIDIYRMDNQQIVFSTGKTYFSIGKVQFSQNNHYLVYRSYDADSHGPDSLQVWDIQKQKLAYIIPAADLKKWEEYYGADLSVNIPANSINPGRGLSNIVIDPNEKFLTAGDSNGDIFIWNLATGKLLHQLKGHAEWIAQLGLSLDGRLLASGSGDATVRLWNMTTGSLARVFTGFLGEISAVDFTPDGQQLNVQVDNHPDQVVDLKTGKLTTIENIEKPIAPASGDPYLAALLQQGYIYSYGSPKIGPDGKTLALISRNVAISRWDIPTKTFKDFWFAPQGGQIQNIAYNAQGEILALVENSQSGFSVWNTGSNRQVFPAKGWQKIKNATEYSKHVSLAPGGDFAVVMTDHHIEIWNLLQEQLVTDLDLTASQSYVGKIIFSQDGSQLYALVSLLPDEKDSVLVLDIKSGRQVKTIPLAQHYDSTAMHWPFLAGSVNDDNNPLHVELLNLENNTLQTLQTATDYTNYPPICFTPDGSLLYLGTDDLNYFWQTNTAQLLHISKDFGFDCSALSPDGKQMAINEEGPVDFWDTQTLMQMARSASVTPAALPTAEKSNTPSPIPTHQPTLALKPLSTPALPAGAIVPENASQLKDRTRFGQGNIEQIVWPTDSASILTVGSQGLYEYDAKTLVRTNQQQPGGRLKGITLTADGKQLVIQQNGEKLQVRELTTGKLLVEATGQNPSISPDGKILAYIDNQFYNNRIHLLDVETSQPLPDLSALGEVARAVFSPDSQLVAAVQIDSLHDRVDFSSETVRVWDARTGQIVNGLGSPNAPISSISFSDDGKYIIGAASGSAWVWPLAPGAKPTRITLDAGHDYSKYFLLFDVRVTSVAISPDNRLLAVSTSRNNILLYDWRNNPGHALRTLTLQGDPAGMLRFGPDGRQLLSADQSGQITLWDVQRGKALATQSEHTGPLTGMRFGDDDNLLVWSSHTFRTVQPQDASTLHSATIADGKIFAVSPDALHLASYLPYQISLSNAQTGDLEQTLKDEPGVLVDWRYSNTAKDFTVATFSSDSNLLAVGGTNDLLFYDLAGNLIGRVYDGYPYPRQILFSPGNHQVAACNENCSIHVFGKDDININLAECALAVAFNPTGDLLAGLKSPCYENKQSHEIVIWSVETGDLVKTSPISSATLTSLTFNADGRLLAVGQADGKILLIETESLKVLATLAGHNGAVDHLAFSNTGKWLASAATDGSIAFWSIP